LEVEGWGFEVNERESWCFLSFSRMMDCPQVVLIENFHRRRGVETLGASGYHVLKASGNLHPTRGRLSWFYLFSVQKLCFGTVLSKKIYVYMN